MKHYSGYEYLCIDVANHYGLDKQVFEDRIQWTQDHLQELETLSDRAECQPLYKKAVMALRKALNGIPTGHLVEADSSASGIQIMSAITGCHAGGMSTNLIAPNRRVDAYGELTKEMNKILGNNFKVSRADAKQCLMTCMYGSKNKPIEIFGKDTPELNAFYSAAVTIAPGAWELLQVLLASWQPYALSHEWRLPDGFDAKVKVMVKHEKRIEVDELDGASFTYQYYVNEGEKKGLSLVANCIHSIDALIVREMHRRCNYDTDIINKGALLIEAELLRRIMGGIQDTDDEVLDIDGKVSYYIEQYERSGMPSVVIVPWLDCLNVTGLSRKHLEALATIVNEMLEHKSFELVTIHDCFKAHPNNMNVVRKQYINILAELAESEILSDLLSQIRGTKGTYKKSSNNLSNFIRKSEYALC